MGESGVASHQFKQLGVIRIYKKKISDNDILELAINAGAEDCISNSKKHEIKIIIYKMINSFKKRADSFLD